MSLLEIIVIIILISWAFGGFILFPITGGGLNLLIVILLIIVFYNWSKGRRV